MDWIYLHKHIISFLLLLYSESSFPRNIVDKVIQFMNDFIKNVFLQSLEKDILRIVETSPGNTFEITTKIKDSFKQHGRVFENVMSESDRFKFFEDKGFTMPIEFKINDHFVEVLKDSQTVFDKEVIYGVRVPLKHSLKYFLQIPGMFNNIIKYINTLTDKSNIVSNIIQAKFWTENFLKKMKNQYILPLYIYYDEIEVGNPLGAHAGINKFGVIYASIATLPPNISSRLDSILFSTIIHSEDFKKTDNHSLFKELIEELKYLYEEGINIVSDDETTINVKFQLVQILGDNLGLNSICGFAKSFKAHHYCRICSESAKECSTMCIENKNLLRNKNKYETDLLLKDAKATGLKENCVFNEIPNFHIAVNNSVDMMHDFLEGVCIYVVCAILYEFIFVKKFFTLHQLNVIILNFNYDSDESNKPPKLNLNEEKQKLNLKYSASEMYCLKYLSLMIGDLIPNHDEHWEMFLTLRKISDILMSPRIVSTRKEIP